MIKHDKNYFCRECGKKFWLKKSLDEHFSKIHENDNANSKERRGGGSKGTNESWMSNVKKGSSKKIFIFFFLQFIDFSLY
jgi:hypothetical protein